MKKRVYIETSVVSFLASRPSENVILAGHQASTRKFWERRDLFDLYISDLVVRECEKGDTQRIADRLGAIDGLPLLDVGIEAESLAQSLIAAKAVPETSLEDAVHIAVAAVFGMDFILTWNFKHINNPAMKRHIRNVVLGMGLEMPEICSPEELLEAEA